MQRSRNHSVFGRNTRVLSEAVESSLGPCKLDHGGLEPNAVAIYEEVMYRILPLIHSSQIYICVFYGEDSENQVIYIYIYIFFAASIPWILNYIQPLRLNA